MSTLEEARVAGEHAHPEGFCHEALFYRDEDEYLAGTAPFILDGIESGEAVLVAVGAEKADLLAGQLAGLDGFDGVRFVEMPAIGVNPARIIPAWRRFAEDSLARGRRFRGIGEPAWPGRSAAEYDECARHESLLNLAFDDGAAWRLLCPYDSSSLPDEVLATAQRTHPVVAEHGVAGASDAYDAELADRALGGALPAPAERPAELFFGLGVDDLGEVRRWVVERGRESGLEPHRAGDLKVAVNELATNSIRYGGGGGTVLAWQEAGELICEVRDRGRIDDPLTGRVPPEADQLGGRGVWLANHLCDLVRVRSNASGATVRVHMHLF